MPAIKLEQFGGMLPAWDPHLLPTGQAAFAQNGYLFSGALAGWRKPKILRALLDSAARMVYRIPTTSETQAIAYLVFQLNAANGDQIVIGELTYTFRTALQETDTDPPRIGNPQDVLIGATSADTANNLVAAVTADLDQNTNAGILYGQETVQNGSVKWYPADTDIQTGLSGPQVGSVQIGATTYAYALVGSIDFGAAFNLVNVSSTSSGVRLTWLSDLLNLAHTTTVYQGGSNPSFDNRITGAATWLEFKDPDTNVIRSPIVDDQWNRFYFASPSRMPEYNTYDRMLAGQPPWLLGVPPPGCAVALDVTGGGNNLVLGNFTESGGEVGGRGNWVYLTNIFTPGDTQIQDVQWRTSGVAFQDDNALINFAAVIYTDNGGIPGSLLNTGKIIHGVLANEPNVGPFVNPTSLLGNTQYWIGIMIDTPLTFEGGPAGGASNTAHFSNSFNNGPPGQAPQGAANSIITSNGTNLANGDQAIIGLYTYTFQNTLTNVPQHVHIGTTADETLRNLGFAINNSGGTPGVDYAASTGQNIYVSAGSESALTLEITARNTGIDGQNIATSFGPGGSPGTLTFSGGPTLNSGLTTGAPGINMWGDFVTSDVIESRSYVYTWVSAYGEEGPPSPPTLLDGWSNATWTLGLWSPPADDLGISRNLKSLNIYRTVVGKAGETVFFFVANVPIGTETYADSAPDNTVALNDQMKSTTWFAPPANLQGFSVMPNGMIAGFVGNEIWFCEPYRPHAWPPGYVLTVDFPIVGLGVTNGALVVCTAAAPYVITGVTPGSLTQSKCAAANPCSSRASILGGDAAVSYMSPNGLIQVTAAGTATNTTDLWFTRENWVQLTPPKYTRAIFLSSCYFCLGSVSPSTVTPVDTSQAQRGFTIELDQDNTSFTIWPQPGGHRLGFEPLTAPTGYDTVGLTTDPWTGIGLVIANGSVWYWDFSDPAPEMQVYTWRSKLYQQNTRRNYQAMKVFFTVPSNTTALNPTRIEAAASDPVWATLPADRWGFLKTYVDVDGTGNLTLIDAREIRSSGELLRIVDGFKCDNWQWEITARVLISNVQIATSVKELANV